MIIGDIYCTVKSGDLEIIGKLKNRKVKVRFVDTGLELYAGYANILSGKVKDKLKPSVFGVGFIGAGNYSARDNSGSTRVYQTWHGIIERSYSEEFQKNNHTYKGCTVCDEWHNFQNFAKWFDDNYPCDDLRYELDKDIKIDGNKIYSPDTCLFVTKKENLRKAHLKEHVFKCPEGNLIKVDDLVGFCEERNLNYRSMARISLGVVKKHRNWTIGKV